MNITGIEFPTHPLAYADVMRRESGGETISMREVSEVEVRKALASARSTVKRRASNGKVFLRGVDVLPAVRTEDCFDGTYSPKPWPGERKPTHFTVGDAPSLCEMRRRKRAWDAGLMERSAA